MAPPDSPELPEALPYNRLDILQADQQVLFYSIPTLAINFAILGCVDVAHRLVSKLNTYHSKHGSHVALRSLWLLWDSINDWPAGEQEVVRKEIEDARKEEKKAVDESGERTGKQAKLEPDQRPITREDVHKVVKSRALGLAEEWWWPGQPNICVWQPDEERARYDQGPQREGLEPSEKREWIKKLWEGDDPTGTLSALDLRISLNDDESAAQSLEDLPSVQQIFDKLVGIHDIAMSQPTYAWRGWKISELAKSRQAWKMLKEGALVKALNVDPEKLATFAKDVEDAVEERLTNGRMEVYPDLSIKELLEIIQKNTKSNPKALQHFEEMVEDPPETIMRSPATEEEIQETEKRLEAQLPEDYKEFMRLTDGLGAPFGGILFDPPLHPLKDTRWFTDDEDYFSDLQLDMPGDMAWLRRNLEDYPNWVLVGKALEIGTYDIFNTWLVPPQKAAEVQRSVAEVLESDEYTDDEKKAVRNTVENFAGSFEAFNRLEWTCVTWTSGSGPDLQAYPSFRAYLAALAKDGGKAEDDVLADCVFFADYLKNE